MYVRNYTNPNKDGWSPAKIKDQLGPRNYTCLLLRENRELKRHTDQIRDGEPLERDDDRPPLESEAKQGSKDEQASGEYDAVGETVIEVENSDDPSENAHDKSLPLIAQRPPARLCVEKANVEITKQIGVKSRPKKP